MVAFRRPTIPRIERPSISRRKNLTKKIGPSFSSRKARSIKQTGMASKDKKKRVVRLGTCYKNVGCKGEILLRRVSKVKCRAVGGKSWKGSRGCEEII